MWKVTIESRYGGDPSVYWVEANTPADAERIARDQLNRRYLADGEPLPEPTAATVHDAEADAAADPDDWWPRPQIINGIRVHTFSSTATGYDQTQYRNDIHDGDVLFVPTERVAGFLMQAWPIAVSVNNGEFHRYTADDLLIDGIDYTANVAVAHTLLDGSAYSVTIVGPQRLDGQVPQVWVVQGLTEADATAKALAAHLAATHEPAGHDLTAISPHGEPVYMVVSVTPGIPGRGQGEFNDARHGADHRGQHDCLAVEDLRHRVQTFVEHRSQAGRLARESNADTHNHQSRVPDDVLAAEAVAIVDLLGAIFERGLS